MVKVWKDKKLKSRPLLLSSSLQLYNDITIWSLCKMNIIGFWLHKNHVKQKIFVNLFDCGVFPFAGSYLAISLLLSTIYGHMCANAAVEFLLRIEKSTSWLISDNYGLPHYTAYNRIYFINEMNVDAGYSN